MTNSPSFSATALHSIPMIQPGDDLASILIETIKANNIHPQDGDVFVISSKIVSKSQNRYVSLSDVSPSDEAIDVAEVTQKDPRIVQLVLDESTGISRKAPNVLITEHRLGFVSANSGIDQSNITDGENQVLLLPLDPDKDAQELREHLQREFGVTIAVVISDSHGRPFRVGNTGVAIGISGMPAILDLRGATDLVGRRMNVSVVAYADLVASAAHLICGEAAEGFPVVHLRGLEFKTQDGKASHLNRVREMDLYR